MCTCVLIPQALVWIVDVCKCCFNTDSFVLSLLLFRLSRRGADGQEETHGEIDRRGGVNAGLARAHSGAQEGTLHLLAVCEKPAALGRADTLPRR